MALALARWESRNVDGGTEYLPEGITPGEPFHTLDTSTNLSGGWTLVAYAGPRRAGHIPVCPPGVRLQDHQPSGTAKNAWGSALGKLPQGQTAAAWLWRWFTAQADHRGISSPFPAAPSNARRLVLRCGPYVVARQFRLAWAIQGNQMEAVPFLRMLRRQYADRRSQDGVPAARRLLRRMAEKHGLRRRQFWQSIQDQFSGDGDPLPHGTTVTDDFSTDTIGSNWTVFGPVTIGSGIMTNSNGSNHGHGRRNVDLGTDHYSQCDNLNDSQYNGASVRVRETVTADADFRGFIFFGNGTTTALRRYTQRQSWASTASYSSTWADGIVRLEASGSTFTSYVNGTPVGEETDSNYPDYVNTGVFVLSASVDDFQAGDLGGGGGGGQDRCSVRMMQQQLRNGDR